MTDEQICDEILKIERKCPANTRKWQDEHCLNYEAPETEEQVEGYFLLKDRKMYAPYIMAHSEGLSPDSIEWLADGIPDYVAPDYQDDEK